MTSRAAKRTPLKPLHLNRSDPYGNAKQLIGRYFVDGRRPTLVRYREEFYRYEGCIYRLISREEFHSVLYDYLSKATTQLRSGIGPFYPNRRQIGETEEALKALTQQPDDLVMPFWLHSGDENPPASEYIPARNGLIHWPSGELEPSSPTYFSTNCLDFDYDSAPPAPASWFNFLESLWGDDFETAETLQEVFGYLLSSDTSQQKIFLLIGPPRSGKGTILRVLTKLVGPSNLVSPTINSLSTNFGLAPLIGKKVATITDARIGFKTDQSSVAERFLTVSGEDAITIDRKHKSAWTGRLLTRFVLATNELPQIPDASGALSSRFIILKLSRSFLGKEDSSLTDRLMPELPAILFWALEGLKRLNERGHFKQPAASRELLSDLEALGSPAKAFLAECCLVAPENEIECKILYASWRSWCEENGLKAGSEQSLGKKLRAVLPSLETPQLRVGGEPTRKYRGITLR